MGKRSSLSSLVGAAPKLSTSKPAIRSSIEAATSTGLDEPRRAIRDKSAMGSTPRSRRSRKASTPRRFDSSSPCGPVRSEWWAKAGGVPPMACMIWICVAVFVTWSAPRTMFVTPMSMSSTEEAKV